MYIEQFQIGICIAHSQVKKHGKVYFQTYVLFLFSNTIFTTRFWNPFPPICIPLSLIEFEFNSIKSYSNCWIELQCCSLIKERIIIFHFKNIWKKLLFHKNICLLIFPMFLILVKNEKFIVWVHISSYIISFWLKLIYIKVISTYHVIDIWTMCRIIKFHWICWHFWKDYWQISTC